MADEQVVAPETGQATAAPEGQTPMVPENVQGQAAPFFQYEDEAFNTREDLEKAWKQNYLRRSDYDKKSKANAQLRKHYENKSRELDEREKQFTQKTKEYESYDKLLQQRPDVYNQLRQALGQPPNAEVAYQRAESLVNDKTGELEAKLQEFEDWKKQQEIEKEKTEAFTKLSQELPDFDQTAIEEYLGRLQEAKFEDLARTIHYARLGEQSPLKVEQTITDKLKKKGEGKTPSPKGSPPSKEDPFKGQSLEARRNAALRDSQGG
jgi:hypothetical protein